MNLGGGNGGWNVSNGAHVLSVLDIQVSRVSPGSSPAVSDDPSWNSRDVSRVSSELDAVIDGLSARSDHSTLIVLPGSCIDADGDWSGGLDVSEHGSLVSSSDIAPSVDSCTNSAWVVLARSIDCSVWVRSISVNSSSSLNVCVSEVGPSSVASVASGVTIDDLLHGERSCGSSRMSLETVHGFNFLSCRESPA